MGMHNYLYRVRPLGIPRDHQYHRISQQTTVRSPNTAPSPGPSYIISASLLSLRHVLWIRDSTKGLVVLPSDTYWKEMRCSGIFRRSGHNSPFVFPTTSHQLRFVQCPTRLMEVTKACTDRTELFPAFKYDRGARRVNIFHPIVWRSHKQRRVF